MTRYIVQGSERRFTTSDAETAEKCSKQGYRVTARGGL